MGKLKPSLTHLALHVKDLNACIEFYQSYCGMQVIHQRKSYDNQVVWLAEEGHEEDFILVVLADGPGRNQSEKDFSHLGFALESRKSVDAIAELAREEGILAWEPKQEPYPVCNYCAVKDPDGNFVEFSFGQPLGGNL